MTEEIEKREIRIPRGAPCGPKGERETLDALRSSRGIVDAITKIGEGH